MKTRTAIIAAAIGGAAAVAIPTGLAVAASSHGGWPGIGVHKRDRDRVVTEGTSADCLGMRGGVQQRGDNSRGMGRGQNGGYAADASMLDPSTLVTDDDTVTSTDAAGEFADSTLQDLYDGLLTQGLESKTEAFAVGALVEETDIQDLRDRASDSDAIAVIYDHLESASAQHLRVFVRNLEAFGVDYLPQVLDADEVDTITGR